MHPAYSVILFTKASGAGYGLLIWLCLLGTLSAVPATFELGFTGFALAFALIAMGLLASTAHLGRPERAWRAFSQWRTSWLSREGVAAMATFVPAGLYALSWVVLGTNSGFAGVLGLVTVLLALATVICTGMIYQSLATIRAWHHPLVTPVYVLLALATGGLLALLLTRAAGYDLAEFGWLVAAATAVAFACKYAYWQAVDEAARTRTSGDATGLGRFGSVRVLDPPHTQANYVMREMGFSVARKHAEKLRTIATIACFAVPLALTLLTLLLPLGSLAGIVLAGLAVIGVAIGVVVERWLFFAEAQHVVTLYYGAATA